MTAPALWTTDAMAKAMGAERQGHLPASISGLAIDSRSIGPGEAFFAIRGERRDGHEFVPAALSAKAALAVVAVDRRPVGHLVDSVLVDNRLGARQATAHLIENGARRVACITGPKRLSTANERLAGYKDALAAAGRRFDESLVLREDFRQAGGYDAVRALTSGRPRAHPDALFVANNQMTVGALQALQQQDLDVPGDVKVVGFDDAPWATLTRPQLTVVAQPTYDIGRTAAELLATARAAKGGPREVVLVPKLVVRESSGRPG